MKIRSTWVTLGIFSILLGISVPAIADETAAEKVQHTGNKVGDEVKEGYRDTKDKVCEMVNGKLECIAKKVKNKAKTAADKTETKAKEIKNKVD